MPSAKLGAAVVAPAHPWFVRAWKWGAGSLSAGAALVSIISSVRSINHVQQVRWIGVAPAADTAWALGDTLQLATTITDGHGGVLPGVSVGWTSTDSSVAVVDSGGSVVARAPGAATIVAAAGGRIAQARVLVRPRPAAIRVFGDSLLRVPEGAATRLVARVVDARRHPVAGESVAWRSADPSIAAIDSAARLTAVMAGRTVLVASGGDLTLELPLEVYPVPATITLQAGDGQHAPAGQRLPSPLKAQVVSRGGRPLAGVAVRFGVLAGGGSLEREVDTSDADGIVRGAWILGGRPGRQRLALGVAGDESVGTTVVADADPLPGLTRIALATDPGDQPPAEPLSGRAGEPLPAPVAVRVTDTTGAPLADVPVAWTADDGGSIAGDAPRTDSLGGASARWTLGPRSGSQQARVQVGSPGAMPRFTLAAVATPGSVAVLAASRSAPVRGQAGRLLAPAVAFRVTDRAGNPVPGVAVTLRTSGGSVTPHAPLTDSAGRATAAWTLGPVAGSQRLAASVAEIERAVELTVQARSGPAAKLTLEGLPATAPAGRALPQPVHVVVTDAWGNAVRGAQVAFGSRAGTVTPRRVSTDSAGRAAARWVLGSKPGEQVLEATVAGGATRATGKVRAVAGRKR